MPIAGCRWQPRFLPAACVRYWPKPWPRWRRKWPHIRKHCAWPWSMRAHSIPEKSALRSPVRFPETGSFCCRDPVRGQRFRNSCWTAFEGPDLAEQLAQVPLQNQARIRAADPEIEQGARLRLVDLIVPSAWEEGG